MAIFLTRWFFSLFYHNKIKIFSSSGKPLADGKREDEWSRPNTRDASFASVASSEAGQPTSVTEELVTALSRSLSVESFDSCEPTPLEQALLEQCIHSGMPHRSKNGVSASAVRTAAGESFLHVIG